VGEFEDELLGRCRYTSFFIVNDAVGGYTADCSFGRIFSDFIPVDRVIDMAKEQKMPIHLTGMVWEKVGKFGEFVEPEEAVLWVSKLREKLKEVV